ncbi:MAG TPA: aspartyl protease family protein [Candidatus Polarisedimenticolia bacterium]|nr:aspartyl protease family protein [Candidatus Polarisedimenticolia bacterium]
MPIPRPLAVIRMARLGAVLTACGLLLAGTGTRPGATALEEPAIPLRVHIGRPSTIPFDSPSGLVILTARINGRSQVRLLLDTGDPSGFTLDTRIARELGLPLDSRTATRATGVVGSQRFNLYRARVGSFLLGGLSARDFSIWTAPDALLIGKTLGIRVDGFVGVDLLRGLTVTLDYPARQITFAPPAAGEAIPPAPGGSQGASPEPAGAQPDSGGLAGVPLRLEGNRIVVDALLNGTETRAMVVDTAAGTTFIAEGDLALTRPSPKGATTQIVDSSGGAVSVSLRILPSLAFGGAVARDVAVVPYDFEALKQGLFAGTPHAVSGILGSDLLSRHVVVLDFPRRTLRIDPKRP